MYVCVCVCVVLVIQYAKLMRSIAICGLSGSTMFFNVISQTVRLFAGGGAGWGG